jgi:phosphatidylglycerophosphate synthase
MTTLVRENRALLATFEKRLLIRMAEHMPPAVTSDHLTVLALVAMAITGAGFLLSRWNVQALWLVIAGLGLNWFGDSLDGTLARVRKAERPHYGFYVDHVLDLAGTTLLVGGLACSPFMSPVIALLVLVGYLLAAGEVFLATAVHGVFRMSFAGVGPTELRLLLAAGTFALFRDPHVAMGALGDVRLFDLGGLIAAAGLLGAATLSAVRNTAALALAEPPRQ